MALRLLLLRHAETDWNRERRYQGWTDTDLSEVGRGQAEAAGATARAPAPGRGLVEPAPPRAGHRRRHRRRAGTGREGARGLHGDAVRRLGGAHQGGGGRALPRGASGLARHAASRRPRRRRDARRGPAARARRPRGAEADARRRDDLPRRARHLGAHLDPRSPRARRSTRLWSLQVSSTGISELEFRPDWTALHRMNTLAHLESAPATP